MTFAYADPPYLGMGAKLYSDHPDHAVYDDPEAHWDLVERLKRDFPDGWAMSASAASLAVVLAGISEVSKVRIGSWVKPFASYKPNVSPAYTWEPVLFMGGRKATRTEPTGRDSFIGRITMRRGFPGAKSDEFAFWLFEDIFNARPDDTFHDLFPGSGAVSRAWETWCGMRGRMTPDFSEVAYPVSPMLAGEMKVFDADGEEQHGGPK